MTSETQISPEDGGARDMMMPQESQNRTPERLDVGAGVFVQIDRDFLSRAWGQHEKTYLFRDAEERKGRDIVRFECLSSFYWQFYRQFV